MHDVEKNKKEISFKLTVCLYSLLLQLEPRRELDGGELRVLRQVRHQVLVVLLLLLQLLLVLLQHLVLLHPGRRGRGRRGRRSC